MKSPATYQGTEGATTTHVPFVFREDGWFNMTKAAKHFGKQLVNFWIAADTREYLEAVSSTLEFKVAPVDLYTAERGKGTWAHPKLAVFFARWLDVRFAVWCDAVIEDILKGKAELVITKPEESAVMALPKDYAQSLRELADAWEREQKLKAVRYHHCVPRLYTRKRLNNL